MNWTSQPTGVPGASSSENVNRSRAELICRSIRLATAAAYGQPIDNPNEIHEVIEGLVKQNILSAEDSYRFRDLIMDRNRIDRYIDKRIERILSRKQDVIN